MPSRDQTPKASSAAINKGDANMQINGSILGGDSPNLRKLGQDIKVKLADLQANLNNLFFSTKLLKKTLTIFQLSTPQQYIGLY